MISRIYLTILVLILQTEKLMNCEKHQKEKYTNGSDTRRYGSYSETEVKSKWIDINGILRRKFAFITGILNPDVSFVGSPISALRPLGKLALGATGNTKRELFLLIGVRNQTEFDNTFKDIIRIMDGMPGANMDVVSQIFLCQRKRELRNYSDELKRVFGSDVHVMDMTNPSIVAANINFWVKDLTANKIQRVLNTEDLKANSELIIVNAIHFHGKWKYSYEAVKQRKFFGLKSVRDLTFLTLITKLKYAESSVLQATFVQVPLDEDEANFVICIPKYRNGLPYILKQLRAVPELLNTVEFETKMLNLSMPKFKYGNLLDLGSLYRKMGLKEAIRGKGLQRMVDGTVRLSKAVQKVVIEITEIGEEDPNSFFLIPALRDVIPARRLVANRPFLFFITKQKQQLFAGQFYGNGKPTKIIN